MALVANLQPANLGQVYTKRWVADWMLDLVGYSADEPLYERTILEPACGTGAFIVPIVERLLAACAANSIDLESCTDAIVARDLDQSSVDTTRSVVASMLSDHGVANPEALADRWVQPGDFLLDNLPPADYIVGNPPTFASKKSIPTASPPTVRPAAPWGAGPTSTSGSLNKRSISYGRAPRSASSAPTGGCATATARASGR